MAIVHKSWLPSAFCLAVLSLLLSGCGNQAVSDNKQVIADQAVAPNSNTRVSEDQAVGPDTPQQKPQEADNTQPIIPIKMHYQAVVQRINDYLKRNNLPGTAVEFQANPIGHEDKIEVGKVHLKDSSGDTWKQVMLTRVQGIWDVEQMRSGQPFSFADAPRGTRDYATGAEKLEGVVKQVQVAQGILITLDLQVVKNDTPNGHLQPGQTVHLDIDEQTGAPKVNYPNVGDSVIVYATPIDPRIAAGDLGWWSELDGVFINHGGQLYNVDGTVVDSAVPAHTTVSIADGASHLELLQPLQQDLTARTYKHVVQSITLLQVTPLITDPERVTAQVEMNVEKGPNPDPNFQNGKQSKIVTWEKTNGHFVVTDMESPYPV